MQIHINGEPRPVPDAMTIAAMLEFLDLTGKRLAVEVNEEVIPKGEHARYSLGEGDRVEIVHAIGGG